MSAVMDTAQRTFTFFAFLGFIRLANSTDCIVSQWSEWSECFGTCGEGLAVRNRDVSEPPLPEPGLSGELLTKVCPDLYVTRTCELEKCSTETDTVQTSETDDGTEYDETSSHNDVIDQDNGRSPDSPDTKTQDNLFWHRIQFSDNTKRVEMNKQKRLEWSPNGPIFGLQEITMTPNTRETRRKVHKEIHNNNHRLSQKMRHSEQEEQGLNGVSMPKNLHSAKKSNRTADMTEVLRKLETALNLNATLDDKKVQSAVKKNKKLLGALVKAHRLRSLNTKRSGSRIGSTTTSTKSTEESTASTASVTASSKPTTPDSATVTGKQSQTKTITSTSPAVYDRQSSSFITDTPEKSSTDSATHENVKKNGKETGIESGKDELKTDSTTTSSISTTTSRILSSDASVSSDGETSLPYWPRKSGYVPNTRQHASDITQQLYMTQEIVQSLSEEPITPSPNLKVECQQNARCCKIEREKCKDGSAPFSVTRYYRPMGSDECLPYHYPRCSQQEEMREKPISYVQNCQDICFAPSEKSIKPLYTLSADN